MYVSHTPPLEVAAVAMVWMGCGRGQEIMGNNRGSVEVGRTA